MRTFIAIDLDSGLKAALASLVRDFAPLAENVKWVNGAGMHLTVKFLGETPDDKTAAISDVLRALCAEHHPFTMRLKGLGFFPPGRRPPRVIWVGVESETRLTVLQRDIESALEKYGFERETREFRPHLTLGRVRFPGRLDRVLREVERRKDQEFGGMPVDKVTFFRSVLKAEGAEYSVLGESPLS